MKPTLRSLQALGRRSIRAKTFGFIGLGRMGSEMAFNLFSKKLSESSDSSFVVCDAIRESVTSFCRNFQSQFAGTHVDIVQTPEEYVRICAKLVSSTHLCLTGLCILLGRC